MLLLKPTSKLLCFTTLREVYTALCEVQRLEKTNSYAKPSFSYTITWDCNHAFFRRKSILNSIDVSVSLLHHDSLPVEMLDMAFKFLITWLLVFLIIVLQQNVLPMNKLGCAELFKTIPLTLSLCFRYVLLFYIWMPFMVIVKGKKLMIKTR